ncbi:lysozyme inhibitor LprI family protein [Brevundimonas sp.]
MIAALALALALPQSAAPSFDCARATTPVERAICADSRLMAQDRQVAAAYARIRRSLSPAAREALARDQRWYLGARDEWFENRDRWDGFPDLPTRMTGRIDFLASLSTERADTLIGRWRNVAGEVEITQTAHGRLGIAADAVQPTNARWLCEGVTVEGAQVSRMVEGVTGDDPAYRIRATLRDGYLEVEEEALTPGSYGPPYCGANGHISGVYFRVR